jgi:hypothetical protein
MRKFFLAGWVNVVWLMAEDLFQKAHERMRQKVQAIDKEGDAQTHAHKDLSSNHSIRRPDGAIGECFEIAAYVHEDREAGGHGVKEEKM